MQLIIIQPYARRAMSMIYVFLRHLQSWAEPSLLLHRHINSSRYRARPTFSTALLFVMLTIAAACITLPSCGGGQSVDQSVPPPSVQYTIGPADVLRIEVWKEEALSQTVPVRTDGKISLPLINDIYVVGLTPLELQKDLTKQFSQFIENPTVSVIVQEINSLKIFVVGNVNQPGVFDVKREINVLQAISLAGGFTEWANKRNIKLFRKHGGVEQVIKINYNKIVSGEHPELNIPLLPGDNIVVP